MINKIKYIVQLLIPLFIVFLVLSEPTYPKDARVSIMGTTEKIKAFQHKEINYLSFSEIVEIIGGTLDWEVIGHQVSYIKDTNRFDLVIGSPYFKRNDSIFNMTFPAEYKQGQLYLPVETFIRFLDQVLHEKISWDKSSKTVRVDSEYFNVTDMAISAKTNGLLIEIYLTSALAYDVFITEGNWINVSIRNGKLNIPRIQSRKDSRYMYNLKIHQQNETGQVSIRLRRKINKWHHKLQDNPPRIQISIADVSFEMESEDTTPHIGLDNKIDIIVIDPGHGGIDYGAIGQRGTREKEVALKIAKELAKLIRKDKQFKVILTRDRDKTVTLDKRAEIANNAACDLFISIHANSSLKKHIRGWNVFFLAQAKNDSARAVAQLENSVFLRNRALPDDNPGNDSELNFEDPILTILNEMIMTEFQVESHDFAMMVDREFRRTLKIPSRGIDQAGFFVLNMVFAPSLLIEAGFISNKREEKLLKDKKYHKQVAKSIYKAIKRFKAKYENK